MKTIKDTPIEPYMTVREVCAYLKITDESLYSWIKTTNIPAHRVGKRWLFDKTELDTWVRFGKGTNK